jgi:hypothetical protein
MASRRVQARPKPGPAEDDVGDCSSPPCFLHEIDPVYAGLAPRPQEAKSEARPAAKSGAAKDEAGS